MRKHKTAQQIAEEAILFKSKKYYTIEQMADTIEANSNALNKILNLPRLIIPKKIAEELEQVAVTNWEIWEFFIYAEEFSTELKNWLNHGKDDNANSKIAIAYLAGKALGVELVEVTGE